MGAVAISPSIRPAGLAPQRRGGALDDDPAVVDDCDPVGERSAFSI
jgi:hypothetical protein